MKPTDEPWPDSAAYAEGYREGQEEMRERAGNSCIQTLGLYSCTELRVRLLPIRPASSRHAWKDNLARLWRESADRARHP